MTVQEAKDWMVALKESEEIDEFYYSDNFKEALQVAIEALEKIEKLETNKTYNLYRQYLSIGTVEELKEAKEKQVAKKPIVKATTKEIPKTHNLGRLLVLHCPVCGKKIIAMYESDLERGGGLVRDAKGCSRCLQAIDFEGYYCKLKVDNLDEDIDWEEGGTSD